MSYRDQKPPRFTPLQFFARLWASRRELPKVQRWLYFWGVPLVIFELVLFVLTALTERAPKVNGWRAAVDVAIAVTDPFTLHTWVAVALAVISVFLVPVIIGAAVGLIVEEQMRRMRRPQEDVLKELSSLRERLSKIERTTPAEDEGV